MKSVTGLFRKTASAGDSIPRASPSASPLARTGWAPTHQHRKGGYYRLISYGTLEADMSPVAIYDDAVGTIWVRSAVEFDDGRFTPLGLNEDN